MCIRDSVQEHHPADNIARAGRRLGQNVTRLEGNTLNGLGAQPGRMRADEDHPGQDQVISVIGTATVVAEILDLDVVPSGEELVVVQRIQGVSVIVAADCIAVATVESCLLYTSRCV